ncbi:MAG: PilZ domain-containing protein [Anaerolineales bacterium]
MSDQRKKTRKKLIAFTPVYDSKNEALLGYVRNLSLLGVMVVGERTVATNGEKVLDIDFPSDLPGLPATRITIPARVVWRKQDESLRFFNIGFEFTQVTPEHAAVFQAIMDRYQFHQDLPAG